MALANSPTRFSESRIPRIGFKSRLADARRISSPRAGGSSPIQGCSPYCQAVSGESSLNIFNINIPEAPSMVA